MVSATFDSHVFFIELRAAGFNDSQAEALVNTIKKAHKDADLATKSDIKDLRYKMREMRYQIIISLGGIIAVAVAILAALNKLL